mgnify:CR=1 FL=1
MNSGKNNRKVSGLISTIVIIVLCAAAAEAPDIVKFVRRQMDPSYKQNYTDIRAERYQGDLYADNEKEYWSITATAHNWDVWPKEAERLYYDLTFLDEDGYYLEMIGYPGQGKIYETENLYTISAMEFLPPGMECEIHFLVAAPKNSDVITCSFYDEDYEEQEIKLKLE